MPSWLSVSEFAPGRRRKPRRNRIGRRALRPFVRRACQFQLEFYVRKLAKNGVRLVSITQEFGDDPMSNMIRQIMALFDEYQSKENAKHNLRAMNENARQEFWNGSRAPIGYRPRGGRPARPQDQENPRDRSAAGRDRPPHLQARARGRRLVGIDGRQIRRRASQRSRYPHPRRGTLGNRRRAQSADPDDLCRAASLQHPTLEDRREEARGRGCRDGSAADHRCGGVRGGSGLAQDPRSRAIGAASSAARPFLPASAFARPAAWP